MGSDYFPIAQRGVLAWIMGRSSELRWQLPFDVEGVDSLQLTARIPDGCERLVGRISAADSSGALVRDAWSNEPAPWRVSEACDFILVPDDDRGQRIVVSLGLAPIVIARPRVEPSDAVIESLHPRHVRLLPAWLADATEGTSSLVELCAGDRVEVIGVSRPIEESGRRLARVGYRDAAQPRKVIGDEDGTRVVLRKISADSEAKVAPI